MKLHLQTHLSQKLEMICIILPSPTEEGNADHGPSPGSQQLLPGQSLTRRLQGVGAVMVRSISFDADLLSCSQGVDVTVQLRRILQFRL